MLNLPLKNNSLDYATKNKKRKSQFFNQKIHNDDFKKKKNHKPVGVVEKRTEKKNRPTNHDAESNNGEQQKP